MKDLNKTDRARQAVLRRDQADAKYIGIDDVASAIDGWAIQRQNLLESRLQDIAQAQRGQQHDGRADAGQA